VVKWFLKYVLMIKELFYFLVFPGLIFSVVAGGFISWVDRKIAARLQFRKGPPLLQPLYDIGKLMSKETLIPKYGSRVTFISAPVFGITGAILTAVLIFLPVFHISSGFNGDIIVIFYISVITPLTYMIGALATGNPLASIGASREMKMMIAYELTFILVLAGIILKSDMSLSLTNIIQFQKDNYPFIGSISGVLLFTAAVFCIQAKLSLVPFDASEAETEIMNGVLIEYSGASLALIKMSKYILLLALPVFVIALFMGGLDFTGIHILWSLLKILLMVFILVLIRSVNPRLTIGQSMRFFFVWMNLIVIIAIVFAIFNL
jgi:NADH-quinone oxidoreductase subunit H